MAKNEVDILDLHEKMLSMFEQEEENIESYKDQIITLEQLLAQPHHLHSTLTMLQNATQELRTKIEDIQSNRSKNFYLMETAELIEEFEKILRKPKKVSIYGCCRRRRRRR